MANIDTLSAFGYTAEVVPEYGMNCIRLSTPHGMEALVTPEDIDILGRPDAYLYGMPILFYPNRISGGKFTFECREYRLPINEPALGNYLHGELHNLPFVVTEQDDEHIIGRFEATEAQPYMTVPHAFCMEVEYRLTEDGLVQLVRTTNHSNKNMPYALAFHTTFRLPLHPDGRAEDICARIDALCEIERNMANYLPTGKRIFKHEWLEELKEGTFVPSEHTVSKLYAIGDGRVTLYDTAKKMGIAYTYDKKYRFCMTYNGGSREFFCMEPQTWVSNCPNISTDREADGFLVIAPGETLELQTQIAEICIR